MSQNWKCDRLTIFTLNRINGGAAAVIVGGVAAIAVGVAAPAVLGIGAALGVYHLAKENKK
ncbi:MAG: hypothetical protein RM022_024770 [Nostoc sp. EfeVER01]|uniref:hypothetical protein n=1 Tax=unclassified Nostoc TaxID=2593658 RepID=UPI002AD21B8A|nr:MULTISPECIES: hypothetical protein [unclassified Nostoc]MDZ7949281.1 hypothetical protein [Nostoc sp. EfeVER01]MDZ7995736.1 hypothetical protein [Nostoc sp. EspVER01]